MTRGGTLLLAFVAGMAIANNYAVQPALSAVAAEPHDAATDELVALYPAVAGRDHPDWEEYRRAMVTDQRVVLRLTPRHAYGLLR